MHWQPVAFGGRPPVAHHYVIIWGRSAVVYWLFIYFNSRPAELLLVVFRHVKLELLTQFPALNGEKYFYLWYVWTSPKVHDSINWASILSISFDFIKFETFLKL